MPAFGQFFHGFVAPFPYILDEQTRWWRAFAPYSSESHVGIMNPPEGPLDCMYAFRQFIDLGAEQRGKETAQVTNFSQRDAKPMQIARGLGITQVAEFQGATEMFAELVASQLLQRIGWFDPGQTREFRAQKPCEPMTQCAEAGAPEMSSNGCLLQAAKFTLVRDECSPAPVVF